MLLDTAIALIQTYYPKAQFKIKGGGGLIDDPGPELWARVSVSGRYSKVSDIVEDEVEAGSAMYWINLQERKFEPYFGFN